MPRRVQGLRPAPYSGERGKASRENAPAREFFLEQGVAPKGATVLR